MKLFQKIAKKVFTLSLLFLLATAQFNTPISGLEHILGTISSMSCPNPTIDEN